eukprot:TRINITY_DN10304_c0_g1_i1.p1 TRINITY_DN10304_c0_g1~~TRINITY_DN10304_c0_g1_i1.p1  ORF type:complete len:148 (+),score=22.90 TRINITY_DN10304_c0_g1_i1:95-538(+)
MDRKDTVLLQKIQALATTNPEIIEEFEEMLTAQAEFVASYSYHVQGSWPKFSLSEKTQKISVKDCCAAWSTTEKLVPVPDIFNDKLDYTCAQYKDIVRLNKEILPVARKFTYFDCSASALGALEQFRELQTSTDFFGSAGFDDARRS